MNDQVLDVGTDHDVPPGVRRRCELRGGVVELADHLACPARSPKMVTGLEGHQDVALDVLEHVATLIIETKSAWRSLVTHGIEMAQERVD